LLAKNGTLFQEILENVGTEHDRVNIAAGMVTIKVAEAPIFMHIT
jgi:hypothetical protein